MFNNVVDTFGQKNNVFRLLNFSSFVNVSEVQNL